MDTEQFTKLNQHAENKIIKLSMTANVTNENFVWETFFNQIFHIFVNRSFEEIKENLSHHGYSMVGWIEILIRQMNGTFSFASTTLIKKNLELNDQFLSN